VRRAISILVALFLSIGVAYAQPKPQVDAPTKTLAESLTGEAKASYDAAVLLYQDNDYDGAFAKFARAHELSKDPRLLWNMAACEKGSRRYYRTYELIDRYLKEGSAIIPVDMVARAEETKHTLRDLFSLVTVRVDPPSAVVLADGQPLRGGLDLGAHKLRVQAEGFEPHEQTLDIPGKSPVTLEVKLKRVVAPAKLSVVAETNTSIAVDGKTSVGQWEGTVPAGKHKIEVTAQGKLPYFAEIDLGEGANRSMLVPLKDRVGIPLWVWIGGGVLLAGGAALAIGLIAVAAQEPPPVMGKLGTIDITSF